MVPEELPGELVTDFELLNSLKYRLADVCHLQSIKYVPDPRRKHRSLTGRDLLVRFPGSQPVSFDLASLELLEKEECVFFYSVRREQRVVGGSLVSRCHQFPVSGCAKSQMECAFLY